MNEESEVLRIVTQRLEGAHVAYMLSGSMAMNYYAQPRMTRDLDIVVELRPGDEARLLALLDHDFEVDIEELSEAIATERMFNAIHVEKVVKVDFIVRKSSAFRREEFERRRQVVHMGAPLWIVSPEDLVLSKLWWAKDSRSDLQLRDVRNLIASVASLDRGYLERCAAELGLTALLSEVSA